MRSAALCGRVITEIIWLDSPAEGEGLRTKILGDQAGKPVPGAAKVSEEKGRRT